MQLDPALQECGICGRNGEDFATCPRIQCPLKPSMVRLEGRNRVYVTLHGVEHGLSASDAWALTTQLVRLMMERANAP